MKNWIVRNQLYIAGAAAGAVAGFFYWKYIGCNSGQCLIGSKPLNSSVYFAFMGALLFGTFKRNTKKTEEDKTE